MERIPNFPEKSISFRSRHHRRKSESSPRTPKSCSIEELPEIHDVAWQEKVEEIDKSIDINHVCDQIDQFIATLGSFDKNSDTFNIEIPEDVETFSKIVESRIAKFCSPNSDSKFGKIEEEDLTFIDAVDRMSNLANALGEFPLSSSTTPSLNRTTMVLQRAMMFLELEFQNILENSRICPLPENRSANEEQGNEECSIYSPKAVTKMKRISSTMFFCGYELECCNVYKVSRIIALRQELTTLGFETIEIEDAQKMTWEQVEEKISTWIKAIKYTSAALFVAERKLADILFEPSTSSDIFGYLAHNVVARIINFVDAVVLTKRSSEKLFKYLDMYEALNNLVSCITTIFSNDELLLELSSASDKIAGACVYTFCDFENAIKCEAARTPVPGGAIHPLTRYVMNYIKYACEYKDTLEQIFRKNKSLTRSISLAKSEEENDKSGNLKPAASPFGIQLKTVVDLLNENLDIKSQLYRDVSLSYIFLMNNGRYILQKIKGCKEILQLVGDTWYRTRSTVVRQYHKSYQRETWVRLLQCLSHEGLQVSNKVNKPLLKERFKSFTVMFEEIHRAQSTWVVSDEQLQSELRVSISAVVIPAYRSFVGRFKQYLDSSRQPDKYIKYQPEDIETMIEGLFEGNPTSMGRRR